MLRKTFLLATLVRHSYLTCFLSMFVRHSYLTLLWDATDHAHTSSANAKITAATQISPTDTSFANRHYNCGDTDHSHKHLLCKRQNNCGDADHSRTHLLRKRHKCGDTDHSHRHLLCKREKKLRRHRSVPQRRALGWTRRRLRTVADGCERLRTVAGPDCRRRLLRACKNRKFPSVFDNFRSFSTPRSPDRHRWLIRACKKFSLNF